MSVNAISEYTAVPKDRVENFNGMQLLYVYWEDHLMYCSPFAFLVAPDMTLGDFLKDVLKPAIADHPDSAKADLLKADWQLNGKPYAPQPTATLSASGVDHKSMLTLRTPGLTGIHGSAS